MGALLAIVAALAATPPAPSRWVTDETGQLAAADRDTLDRELAAFEKATGRQVVVWVGRTTGGEPIEDWAVRTFEAWKVGRAGLDDGVALFVLLDDRTARIEVGYGLEERLTDAQSSRILRDVLIPKLKAGDPSRAVAEATGAIVSALGGEQAPPGAGVPEPFQLIAFVVVAALFVVLLIVNPRAAFFLIMLLTGRRRGGGPGGFQGGGGRSGGGGATGRW